MWVFCRCCSYAIIISSNVLKAQKTKTCPHHCWCSPSCTIVHLRALTVFLSSVFFEYLKHWSWPLYGSTIIITKALTIFPCSQQNWISFHASSSTLHFTFNFLGVTYSGQQAKKRMLVPLNIFPAPGVLKRWHSFEFTWNSTIQLRPSNTLQAWTTLHSEPHYKQLLLHWIWYSWIIHSLPNLAQCS